MSPLQISTVFVDIAGRVFNRLSARTFCVSFMLRSFQDLSAASPLIDLIQYEIDWFVKYQFKIVWDFFLASKLESSSLVTGASRYRLESSERPLCGPSLGFMG